MTREDRFETEAFPHLKALYGTAYRMTRNAHDAEDLLQETCLRAYRAFDRFTPGTNARAWLYKILYRVRADAFRKKGRTIETVELVGDGPAVASAHDVRAAHSDQIEKALAGIPEAFRTAVLLRDAEGFTYEEIADILTIPLGTVMSRIHRGRALLRAALGGKP